MLRAHLVERPDDGALEQAPHALDAVGVDVADDPFLGRVVDRLVARILVTDPDVALEIVSIDGFGFVLYGAAYKLVERVLADVRDALNTDAATAFDGPCDLSACCRASSCPDSSWTFGVRI